MSAKSGEMLSGCRR